MQYYFNSWMNNSPSTLSPLRFDRLSDRVSTASENSRSDDVLAAAIASRCWATWDRCGHLAALFCQYEIRDVGSLGWYTALHNSQSHRISQSQALSARFIIFCFRYHVNTVLNATVPAVLPQSLSPLQWYYRSSCFHYRGKSAVTAVLPLSPLPFRSLIHFSRWRPWPLNTTSGFVFADVTAFRRSKSISKPNFVDTSQLSAEI